MLMFWLCVIGATVVQITSGCNCSSNERHPQTHFCKADFAVKAKVLIEVKGMPDRDDDGSLVTSYRIDVLEVFKHPNNLPIKKGMNYIWTPKIGSCKQHFKIGIVYLILGTATRKLTLKTISCHLNQIWVGLPKPQTEGLREHYQKNCDKCKIHICQKESKKGNCDVPWCCGQVKKFKPSQECLMVTDFPHSSVGWCYRRYSYCEFAKGECGFKKTPSLNSCVNGQEQVDVARGKGKKASAKAVMRKGIKKNRDE